MKTLKRGNYSGFRKKAQVIKCKPFCLGRKHRGHDPGLSSVEWKLVTRMRQLALCCAHFSWKTEHTPRRASYIANRLSFKLTRPLNWVRLLSDRKTSHHIPSTPANHSKLWSVIVIKQSLSSTLFWFYLLIEIVKSLNNYTEVALYKCYLLSSSLSSSSSSSPNKGLPALGVLALDVCCCCRCFCKDLAALREFWLRAKPIAA